MTKIRSHVFGFHPSSRGFGWVVFEDHLSLLDWGVVDVLASDNAVAMRRMESLLKKHRPGVLALERHEERRHDRIGQLCSALATFAENNGITVCRFSRTEIANSRSLKGARTRQEVAGAVADCLSVLRPRLPKPQQIWIGERSAMRLFCAAACALAYFDTTQP